METRCAISTFFSNELAFYLKVLNATVPTKDTFKTVPSMTQYKFVSQKYNNIINLHGALELDFQYQGQISVMYSSTLYCESQYIFQQHIFINQPNKCYGWHETLAINFLMIS